MLSNENPFIQILVGDFSGISFHFSIKFSYHQASIPFQERCNERKPRAQASSFLSTLTCALALSCPAHSSGTIFENKTSCEEPYGQVIVRAREQWPRYEPYMLEGEVMRSFVAGYNLRRKGGEALVADQITVFPLYTFDTWYFLAGLEGCFVFWADLAPEVAQELMDNGPRGPVWEDIEN